MRAYNNNDNFKLKRIINFESNIFTECRDPRYFSMNYSNLLHISEMAYSVRFGKYSKNYTLIAEKFIYYISVNVKKEEMHQEKKEKLDFYQKYA